MCNMDSIRDSKGLTEAEFLERYDPDKYPKPSLTADIVIFKVHDDGRDPEVLLIRRKGHPFIGHLALPGGFAERGETIETTAARELAEETGVNGLEMKLVGIYSRPGRDPRGWTVSAAYTATVKSDEINPVAGDDARWYMYNNGLLEIAGTGKMYDCEWDYSNHTSKQPWSAYRDMVTSVVIDDGINYIGECSFREFKNVTSIKIPKDVTSIGWCAYYDCNSLREFIVTPDNPEYCSVDGVLFNKSMTSLLTYPAAKPGVEYTIPYGVTFIDLFAFQGCSLKIINIPNTVTKIGGSAFADCYMLEEIILPPKLTRIPSNILGFSYKLKKVTIQDNVNTIGEEAFRGCNNLKDIYYTGTLQRGSKIVIEDYNQELVNIKIHFKGEN